MTKKRKLRYWLFDLLRPRCMGCGQKVNFDISVCTTNGEEYYNLYCYSHCGINQYHRWPIIWPFHRL